VDSEDNGLAPALLVRGALVFVLACAGAACASVSTHPAQSSWDPSPTPQDEKPQDAPTPAPAPAPTTAPPEEPTPEPATVATDETTAPVAPPALASSVFPDWLHGSLAVRYRGRTNGSDSDHDVGGLLALDVVDPKSPRVSAHLQARVDLDLDGHDDGPFGSLNDTYDGALVSKLYLAYADVALGPRPEDSPGFLRIGRQSDPRLPEVVRLDGVAYSTRPLGKYEVEAGGYVGIPVHLYDSDREGDRAFGTFVEGIPWKDGRARLDWMHLEDEDVLGEGKDDLISLALWQQVAERWRLEGSYSHLEGDPRDLRLRALYGNPETATTVRFGFYELLEPQKALVTELDPFFEQLAEYEPYREGNVVVSQPLTEHTVLDVGVDARRVSDSGDVGEFNRDWERYYATATFSDLTTKGLALAVTADLWDDDDRDINTFGADLSYESQKKWKAAVGTYYSLYKYVFLELDEREDVRTYYFRTNYDLSKGAELELLYELENDDLDTYNTLRLGARWRF